MSLWTKVKMENAMLYAASVFYAVTGVMFMALLSMADFPPHMGIIGALSLVAPYGILRRRSWAIWFIVILLLVATTFAAYTLFYSFWHDLYASFGMTVYLILTWLFAVYSMARRKAFEN